MLSNERHEKYRAVKCVNMKFIKLLYDSLWSLLNQKEYFDVTFYCEQPSHFQNIESVCEEMLNVYPGLRALLVLKYKISSYQEATYPSGLKIVDNFKHRRLRWLKTKVLYTPFVGLRDDLKPKDSIAVHSLVSLTSLDGVYSTDMFDGYDYILCAGPHHYRSFIEWAEKHSALKGKVIVPMGYPKLDKIIKAKEKYSTVIKSRYTVIYAPTHVYHVNEKLASLRCHGEKIIDSLICAGYDVIFRPHPVSFSDADSGLVDSIVRRYASHSSFNVDCSKDYFESYDKADLMVTDVSGTGFTFSLGFLKPTIFFSANADAEAGLSGIQFSDREMMGGLVRDIPGLISKVSELKSADVIHHIKEYRADNIFNVGKSADYIVKYFPDILAKKTVDDWLML